MDAGPIILQSSVPVMEDDTEDTLAARIFDEGTSYIYQSRFPVLRRQAPH